MADLGFVSTVSVSVGQILTFSFNVAGAHPVSYPQSAAGQADVLIINNLSGCTFQVTLLPTGRSFTLPSGVPTNPLPLGLRGVYDESCTLLVESIAAGAFANQVHFDWFSANEPVLFVASSGLGAGGGISTTNITTSSITWIAPDTWTLQEDGSGNMDLSDSTTGNTILFQRNGQVSANLGFIATNNAGSPAVFMAPNNNTMNTNVFEISDQFASAITWFLYKAPHASGDALNFYDATNAHNILTINPSTGGVNIANGPLAGVNGQSTIGSFGVPVIVAQKIRQNVTTVGSYVQIVNFTPAVTGLYRVSGYLLMQDTAARALAMEVSWTDPDSNTIQAEWVASVGAVSGQVVQSLDLSNLFNNGVGFGCFSAPFMAKAAAAIIVQYQHPTGTANDFVSVVVERMA